MLRISIFILFLSFLKYSTACHPQFEKELRYLDLYLGIKPDNDGELLEREPAQFASYVSTSSDLNCDLEEDCLWSNAKTDGLLDTSDWWYFTKSDNKLLPVQIQPGNPEIPVGSHILVAGNTSQTAESAVLLSAAVACQRGFGNLTFSYWLYNHANIEVIAVRANNRRKHLQALLRPQMNCHFLRPGNELCVVQIPPINEPFRIAIRAFNLKDNVVGSMAMIANITYDAETCGESPFPSIFSSVSLEPPRSIDVDTMTDLDCTHPRRKCAWGNAESTVSEWRIGRSVERWHQLMEVSVTESRPNTSFLFLVVDSLSPRPYATLSSVLIPCTQKTTTLSFRYWLKAGTQVEVCSVDQEGVPLSCAYLAESDSPGPIEIDVDSYQKPFRFTVEIIAFDETSIGLVAISDLRIKGLFCHEEPPPVVTTIDPPTVAAMFGLQSAPGNLPYPLHLNCDFSQDSCSQWVNDDGKVFYGTAPKDSETFPVPRIIKGNVATFMLTGNTSSVLRSREVPCAHGAKLTITFMKSEHAKVRLCALGQCVEGEKNAGQLTIPATSSTPFEFTVEAQSTSNAIVVLSELKVSGDVCPLMTVEQIVCQKLQCSFSNDLCSYDSVIKREGDIPLAIGRNGLSVVLGGSSTRSVLRSPRFDLPGPSTLVITLTQSTFGSRVLLCPNAESESETCHELLGPRVMLPTPRRITFPLDAAAHYLAIVLYHDKAPQFGPASFEIHQIDIRTSEDYQLCY